MWPSVGQAAQLLFTPTPSQSGLVEVVVSVDPAGEHLNAVAGTLTVSDPTAIEYIMMNDSVVSLWIDPPKLLYGNQNQMSFSGAMLHGFSGVVQPGVSDKLPGELFTMYLSSQTDTVIQTSSFEAFKHDGLGTAVAAKGSDITIQGRSPSGDQVEQVSFYPHAPIVVQMQIVIEPLLFDGQPTLLVTTSGGAGGVAYLELLDATSEEFVRIESPYQLPTSHTGNITVAAVDMAGNRTEASLIQTSSLTVGKDVRTRYSLVAVGLFFLLVSMLVMYRRRVRQS